MKSIICNLILISSLNYAQILPLTEMLDSPHFAERFEALKIIVEDELIEYIPELESRFLNQESYFMQYSFLEALEALNAPNIYDLAIDYYNNIDSFNPEPPYTANSKLESKARMMWMLFKYGDYSKASDVFDYLDDPEELKRFELVISDLEFIYNHIPVYQSQALGWVLNILNNNSNSFSLRKSSLWILDRINYSEIINVCLGILEDAQENPDLKYAALKVLYDRNYSELRLVLRERILFDSDDFIRFKAGSGLLQIFGLPSDLKLIIDHYPSEPNEDTKGLFEIIVAKFIPPRPTVPTSEMITNLIGYTDELYQYGWITEVSVYNQYLDYLKDIEKAYSNEEKELLCAKLTEYSDYTESLHRSLLTEEGYKFMHYHGIYIKENVEEEFGKCD